MRTRILNKMTAREVEEYLARGGDTIFIAVGVIECHGELPVDCETIGPEAYCKLLAEKADGLALINLPYFFPGGTRISNATVQMSVKDSYEYLMKIGHSLVDQGFRRIFLVSGHGPAPLAINAFCWDFFDETLIHPCHLMHIGGNMMGAMTKIDPEKGPTEEQKKMLDSFHNKAYGAYKVMGQIDCLQVDPNWVEPDDLRLPCDPVLEEFANLYKEFGSYTSRIYSDPNQHGGGTVFKSEEERLAACASGEEALRRDVENCHIVELKDALGRYQDYVREVYKKFPRVKVER